MCGKYSTDSVFKPTVGWTKYFVQMAEVAAIRSKDQSTQVGAVLVKNQRLISTGYNGFPTGVAETRARWDKPAKYTWVEHAERNAIYSAASAGIAVSGATLVLWASSPIGVCTGCARAIIQSGITRIVGYRPDFNRETYGEDFAISYRMFHEAGIQLVDHNDQPLVIFDANGNNVSFL